MKNKIFEWAINALVSYLQENGPELVDQVVAWIKSMVDNAEDEVFGSPEKAPAGCEEFCTAQAATLATIVAAEKIDTAAASESNED